MATWTKIWTFGDALSICAHNDRIYMARVGATYQELHYYNGSSWTKVRDLDFLTDGSVSDMISYSGTLFLTTTGTTNVNHTTTGIWASYDNGVNWTQEWLYDSGGTFEGRGNNGRNFIICDSNLYQLNGAYIGGALDTHLFLGRNFDGTWTILDSRQSSTQPMEALSVYSNNLYLGYTNIGANENHLVLWDGTLQTFTTDLFSEPWVTPLSTRHEAIKSLKVYQGNLYAIDSRYMHVYDGSTWSLQATFSDTVTTDRVGPRELFVTDDILFCTYGSPSSPLITDILKFEGTLPWVGTGGVGSFTDTHAPEDLLRFNDKLYCFHDNDVWVWSEALTPEPVWGQYGVKAIAMSKGKSDDNLWVTTWQPTGLYLKVYDGSSFALLNEVYLGACTETELNNYEKIAYPYAPEGYGADVCFVFGRFTYGSLVHIMVTTDGGNSFTLIENSWGGDDCGALTTKDGIIYCVRNKAGSGLLYSGAVQQTFRSIIPFPVNVHTLKFDAAGGILSAGNRVPDNVPRTMAAVSPFNNWIDITLNYPTTQQVTSMGWL